MSMRDKYTKPGAQIYYYEVEWDSAKLSWKNFRENVIGATDPTTALDGSMRREVFKKFEELGLKSVPNIGDNSIHASASPFEALCERMNWLERKLSDDEFGRALLDSGIPQDTINKWILDPQIDLEGGKMSLFDSLEDINTDECLTKCQTIAGANMPLVKINKNQAFIFIKPHAVTGQVKDFVAGRLAELKFTILSQGTLSSEIIEKKKLIDNHYYAIANKATLSQPKDLNPPAQKKEEFLKKFGISWESALADEVVYNAMEGCNKLGINGTQLNTIWATAKENKQLIKFGGGFYCGKVNAEKKIIVVTGANKGIGFAVVRGLLKDGHQVIATSRDTGRGKAAENKLREELGDDIAVEYCKLEITSADEAAALAKHIKSNYKKIDSLINNAGFAYKGDTWGYQEAVKTIGINVHGTINVTENLIPLIRLSNDPRIVNTCSFSGKLTRYSKDLQQQFRDTSLTLDGLKDLLTQFGTAVKDNDYDKKGWPKTMYGVSKAGEIAYGKILAREEAKSTGEGDDEKDDEQKSVVQVYNYCPGWCKSDMAGHDRPPRTAEDGADTAIWLATTDKASANLTSGSFYKDRNVVEW